MEELHMMGTARSNQSEVHIKDVFHQSIDTSASDVCDMFGDSEVTPRVGHEYQAEIPLLMTVPETSCSLETQNDGKHIRSSPYNCLEGKDIPIMRINIASKNKKHQGGLSIKSSQNGSNMKEPRVRSSGITSDDELSLMQMKKSSLGGVKKGNSCEDKGEKYYLVPGSMSTQWSQLEESSFLLGLYIFGKNLDQVKKLINTKTMGDVLFFYYGKFYRTDGYLRWSECRKIRSRKCGFGQRIFTGSRQQELLSRLLPHLSPDCQNSLQEVSKAFGEGKCLFEEYIMELRSLVGISKFIEAVGIGKGKRDLTGLPGDLRKSNQVLPRRRDIPIGKACSSLSLEEIVKILTGDIRLSKARSHDLFWEAVWPRLLDRGWNSEQPKNRSYAAGSNSLVFLVPGIKKFSRKLVKGTHYYDSVTDVLSRVAADPGLIKLGNEVLGNNCTEELPCTDVSKVDQGNISKQPRHCYLQPRMSNNHTDIMEFTVVDTSTSVSCEENQRVTKLRSLPVESSCILMSSSNSEETGDNMSQVPTDESNSSDNLSYQKNQSEFETVRKSRNKRSSCVPKEFEVSSSNGATSSDSGDVSAGSAENDKTDVPTGKPLRMAANLQKSRPINIGYLAPVTKLRRVTACSRADLSKHSCSIASKLEKPVASLCPDHPDSGETVVSEVDMDPMHDRGSLASSQSKESSMSECILSSGGQHPDEKHALPPLFDLNLPVPAELDIDKSSSLEMTEGRDDLTKKQVDGCNEHKTSIDSASPEQQCNVNPQRQSTRNRPLTTRALEAFACGFLSTRKNRKRTSENLAPKRAKYARVRVTKSKVDGEIEGYDNKELISKFEVKAPVSGP